MLQRPVTAVAVLPGGDVYAWVLGSGLLAGREPELRLERRLEAGEGDLLHLAIDPADSTRLLAVDAGGVLIHSTDGGHHWQPFAR